MHWPFIHPFGRHSLCAMMESYTRGCEHTEGWYFIQPGAARGRHDLGGGQELGFKGSVERVVSLSVAGLGVKLLAPGARIY